MDPEEPIAPWFDDVFEQLGEGRSATLRRRLAATRASIATQFNSERPGEGMTPDLFVAMLPRLILDACLPAGHAAARSYVSAVSRLVEVSTHHISSEASERARLEVRGARRWVDERVANAPIDPRAQAIPARLLR